MNIIFVLITLCIAATALTMASINTDLSMSDKQNGNFKSLRAASTAPLLGTNILTEPLIVDGVQIQPNQEVLLKDELEPSQNGIYIYQSNTLLRRPMDTETSVFVQAGDTNRNKLFTYKSGKISLQDTVGAVDATTSDIREGTNLFHTKERARLSVSAGYGLKYSSASGTFDFASPMLLSEKVSIQGDSSNDSILQHQTINSSITFGVDISDSGRFKVTRNPEIDLQPMLTITSANDTILSSNLGIGATPLNAQLQVAQGGIAFNSGLTGSSTRPPVSATVGAGEIRGHGSTFSSDNGWLELTAGGGTNTNAQTTIELSGSSTIPDMDRNIVMRTAGTERVRITSTGAVTFTGSLSCAAATVTSLNAGSGAIQTTGSLSGGAATVTSLNAGSGTIQTTGSVSASTATASQLQLATSGGTPSDLNFYEEASESITFTGPWASNRSTTIHYVRVGRLVSMIILGFNGSLTTSTNITSTTGIAARFRPGSSRFTNIYVYNNSFIRTAVIRIANTGILTAFGTETLGAFTGVGNLSGIETSAITYHLNGTF